MSFLLHSLLQNQANIRPDSVALRYKDLDVTYHSLNNYCDQFSSGCLASGTLKGTRIGVYLPKSIETVIAFFGCLYSGSCLVPINHLLKGEQVKHILNDCDIEILITNSKLLRQLNNILPNSKLRHIVLIDDNEKIALPKNITLTQWDEFCTTNYKSPPNIIDADLAAIFYTSGSTGKPKGVVLSHRNMFSGAESVATYLKNTSDDKILSVLPFSFDYGFSQLTTSFYVGATVVLLNYLLPKDVVNALNSENITGLAAVPPLWLQISQLEWPEKITKTLRYITNSGGALPEVTIKSLINKLPNTEIYLMYGLTEAFRSTYLPPSEIHSRPTSMGKAIPNAEVLVLRPDGTECDADEIGELVHRGALVSQGYWNDYDKTAARFKKLISKSREGVIIEEIAVWSGDSVKKDKDGFFYFIGRKDEMIKSSGYRISPSEIEECASKYPGTNEVVALGLPHSKLGQAVVLVYSTNKENEISESELDAYLRNSLPLYMLPNKYITINTVPRNNNGKYDRKKLYEEYKTLFSNTPQ